MNGITSMTSCRVVAFHPPSHPRYQTRSPASPRGRFAAPAEAESNGLAAGHYKGLAQPSHVVSSSMMCGYVCGGVQGSVAESESHREIGNESAVEVRREQTNTISKWETWTLNGKEWQRNGKDVAAKWENQSGRGRLTDVSVLVTSKPRWRKITRLQSGHGRALSIQFCAITTDVRRLGAACIYC